MGYSRIYHKFTMKQGAQDLLSIYYGAMLELRIRLTRGADGLLSKSVYRERERVFERVTLQGREREYATLV